MRIFTISSKSRAGGTFSRSGAGRRVDQEVELGGEPYGTQHAHRIFAVALLRVADHAQGTRLDVAHAVMEVVQHAGHRIVIEGIDGEVAPLGVFGVRAEDVVVEEPAVCIHRGAPGIDQAAESGDFHRFLAVIDVHDLEAASDDMGAAKKGTHLLGMGVGGDVEVFGRARQEQVTHRATHHVRLMAVALQRLAHEAGAGRNVLGRDAVARGRQDGRHRSARFGDFGDDFFDEFADHGFLSTSRARLRAATRCASRG